MTALPAPADFARAETIAGPASRDLLRFITCGSVDDGKSTLIGRLLYDNGQLFEDQLDTLRRDSRRSGTQGGALDLALALDGLAAEREQGITIDVAYRYFSTARRAFIVADTPGHEQYTRNMATGASTADAAILLVDATKGLSPQTRRHSLLVAMLGIRHVAVAVNKMDRVGFDEARFAAIMAEYRALAAGLGLAEVTGVPMAALSGDNVVVPSTAMPWYRGPTLLSWLETVEVAPPEAGGGFRLAVQSVSRPDASFRGFAGMVTGGPVRPGQSVTILPSGSRTRVARIVTYDGDLEVALPGQSVTLTLADETDVSRGSVIASGALPQVADRAEARLFWMSDATLAAGATYLAKIGTQIVPATITAVRSRFLFDRMGSEDASTLRPNDVGDVVVAFDRPIALERYGNSRDLGGFILIERESRDTVAMGLVQQPVLSDPATVDAPALAAATRTETRSSPWLEAPFAARWRSILKTVTWRLLGTILTVIAAWLLTRDLHLALLLGGIEILVKFALYFGHERLWAHIGIGLRPTPSQACR